MMLRDKTYGLFMGDCLLRGFLDDNEPLLQNFKNYFNLDVIRTEYVGGGTLNFLASKVFPRQVAQIVNENDNDAMVDVFLSAGAVDLSNAISDSLQFDFDYFISHRNNELMRMLNHPVIRCVYLFPLPPRKICKGSLGKRFPKYLDKNWISFANVCIDKINMADFQFHNKLKILPPISDLHHCLANDGIHLTDKGKYLLLHSVFKSKEEQLFSQDDFPPLWNHISKKSPLQPIDCLIAFKEKAMRARRKEKSKVLVGSSSKKSLFVAEYVPATEFFQ